ncbi:uncharacterized protein BO66DRAFT_367625 [Aspergillus aculeatinus CBS 121060]|uniref:Uncharacterized protein n=1 Tax=Aspergillus aculeatinus CBS 121060 TaxID=1448322 RepID=A0ACD1HH26_9EURO|nr:hypothetical protein BO66DRAFT_367625 [Aspergillus aculeatinus CBS 121060]RAH73103.1 hypothetical protein BO66DRAFT_367625 [Aspergillus aculeatinus CBS 121060]
MANTPLYHQLSRLSFSAVSIIGCIYLILCLVFLGYYHSSSYRDPTSLFFDPSRAYQKRYSSKRIAQAEAFLASASSLASPTREHQGPPAVCVGIVTVRRRGDQYVGLTVASLLDGLTETERNTMRLYLRVGNTDPKEHPIFSEKWVETLPDRLLTYSQDDPDFGQLRAWEEGGWYRNKTIYDFTTLMKDCYETGADYVVMIEDDTLAVNGWFPSALQALDAVHEKAARQGQEWIYLRLFYVDGLLGWNSEEWPQYLAWSFILWALLTGTMVVFKTRVFTTQLRRFPTSAIWLASSLLIPGAILFFFISGRQKMWPIAPGVHEMNKYGCCSQGLVFPRAMVPRFLEQTDLTTDWLVDMMVETIADSQGWTRWAVVPPLLQHIGATSSKGYGFDSSAKTIWNFRFEEYDQ